MSPLLHILTECTSQAEQQNSSHWNVLFYLTEVQVHEDECNSKNYIVCRTSSKMVSSHYVTTDL